MRVMVYDLGNVHHRLVVNWHTWHATLELFYRHHVLDVNELDRLVWRLGGAGTSIGEREARAIADYLDSQLKRREDVWVDGPFMFDAIPGGTTIFRESIVSWDDRGHREPAKGVRLSADWLEQLAVFCGTSNGIGAIQEGID